MNKEEKKVKLYTPYGELEMPRLPKNLEEEKLLMASLQGSYEVMASQGYSLDDINKFAVANWLECVVPKPTRKRLVDKGTHWSLE